MRGICWPKPASNPTIWLGTNCQTILRRAIYRTAARQQELWPRRGAAIGSLAVAIQSYSLPLHRAFREADIVHYHIVHDGYFGLDALPLLSRMKPSIWIWHDPWPMTGHCIYPASCERWKTGCGSCPMPNFPFAMRHDRTGQAFRWKQRLLVICHKSRRGQDKAVIVFSGSFLPKVARAPDVGLQAPAGDVEALAAAIRRLAENGEERRAGGLAGGATAEELYGDRLFALRLGDLYRSVVARRRDPGKSRRPRRFHAQSEPATPE